MKLLILVSVMVAVSSGCTNMPAVVRELSKDPAGARMTVTSVYGTIVIERAVPSTNHMEIGPNGIITGSK